MITTFPNSWIHQAVPDEAAELPFDAANTDEAILAAIHGGDIDAFERLLRRYEPTIFRIAHTHLPAAHVAEVAQEIALALYRSLDRFDGKSPLQHYVAAIATRRCYDFWRREKRRRETAVSELSDVHNDWLEQACRERSREEGERRQFSREAHEILQWGLARMSAADRTVLTLVYIEGCSHREASERLGWTQVNVKVRAFRARQALRTRLQHILDR